MGKAARRVQGRLRERLARGRPDLDWHVERAVGGTPVDVVGAAANELVLVEIEWRRADPANNAVKLFRHLREGNGGAVEFGCSGRVRVFQVFSRYTTWRRAA